MAVIRCQSGNGGGTNYESRLISGSSLSTGSFHAETFDFVPKHIVLYTKNLNGQAVIQYWEVDDNTLVSTFQGYFESDNSSEIGSTKTYYVDGKTVYYKAPNAYYCSDTRLIVTG